MQHLANAIRRQAQDLDGAQGVVRYGVIVSVDPVRHLAKVALQPDGVLSSWLEIATPVPGWQMLPAIGTQAVVIPREGDTANGIVMAYAYSNPNPPPQTPNAPGGGNVALSGTERVLTGPGGSVVRFCADGSIYIQGALKLAGNLAVTGSITATGAVTAGLGGADQVGLQTHKHSANNTAPTAGT